MPELPTVFLYMTREMRERCFRPSDLRRIEQQCRLITADAASGDDLPAAWPKGAAEAEVVITGWHTPALTSAMLDAATKLKLILHAAGSVRYLVPDEAFGKGIRVASANGALARGVAETVLGLTIVGLKGVIPASRMVAAGGWKQGDFGMPGIAVRETFGSTVGIIGAGQVGRHVIDLLRPLGVRVVVADPYLPTDEAEAMGATVVSLDDLLRQSDVVSLSAPSLASTRHMMGARQFALMKDGAVFINTARGALVDEDALVAELRLGRIWAFLDVTDPEPPRADHPLRSLPNAVLTPHLAGALNNGCYRLGADTAQQVEDYFAGQPVHGEVEVGRRAILA